MKIRPIAPKVVAITIATGFLTLSGNALAAPGQDAIYDRLSIGSTPGLSGDWTSIAGGDRNTNGADYSTIAGGQLNTITNSGDDGWNFIGGGYGNLISDEVGTSVIGGGSGNFIGGHTYIGLIAGGGGNVLTNGTYSVIGGGVQNTNYHQYATVAGGGFNCIHCYAGYSTISGGGGNTIYPSPDSSGPGYSYCTISGGGGNRIWTNSGSATIGGGWGNSISNNSGVATIAGGSNAINTNCPGAAIGGGTGNFVGPNAPYSTIAGGQENLIKDGAYAATIPGGLWNRAQGDYSFAAGLYANADHNGCFVWADSSSDAGIHSTGSDQFIVRANGGIWLGRNNNVGITNGHFIDTSTGAYLSDAGLWYPTSDRNAKRDFLPVSAKEVLQKVVEMPVSSWSYKAENPCVRHIGPMAQDFHAAFRLGEDDRHISSIDEDGVALAAIQGLHEVVREKEAEITELKKEVSALRKQTAAQQQSMTEWEGRFLKIEKAMLTKVDE